MPTTAFLTDSTLCIGCKACEVACKEYNEVPADGFAWSGLSYDNTVALGHSTWRHVKFVEMTTAFGVGGNSGHQISWSFSSDVCKHCAVAGCLEACPTGSIVRTEFGSVYVQPDVCNGCGYCVVGCPFGVIDRRPDDGRAFKCTFCYDRQRDGGQPACAKACPTNSILFGELDELRARADSRIGELPRPGIEGALLDVPLLKAPVWTWEVPVYFFVGGAAGAAAIIGTVAEWSGADGDLARDARWIAAAGGPISAALLTADLGRPERFLNMLRVLKPQSAMSVGSWTLTAFSATSTAALIRPLT